MIFIGVDVGIKGAIAALDKMGKPILVMTMPVIKNHKHSETSKGFSLVNIRELKSTLYPAIFKQDCKIAMERVYTGKGSAKGAITSGINYGRVWSVLELTGHPVRVITHPALWQKPIFKKYGTGLVDGDTKSTSVAVAQKVFGNEVLMTKGAKVPKDGIADALLIAEYLRLQHVGEFK